MNKGREILKSYLPNIPTKTGVYRYFNERGEIIYVGKAVDLHKRISNYLDETKITLKTKKLVSNIAKVEFTIVDTEQDAFLLENNLIKKYQPFYNILLKDGKSYPKIVITREKYPRIYSIRDIKKVKGEIYGPYSNNGYVNYMLQTINKLYPIRTCRYDLTKNKKVKVCLKYYLGKCCGICENISMEEKYNEWIKQIRKILNGNAQEIISDHMSEMKRAADNMQFETAQEIKNKIQILVNFKSRSIVTNTNVDNVDIYALKGYKNENYVTVIHINKGSITQTKTIEYKLNIEESKEYILSMAIKDTREMLKSNAKTVIVPFLPENTGDYECRTPKNKIERDLFSLAEKNVEEYYKEKIKQTYIYKPDEKQMRILTELADTAHLKTIPIIIDSFDVSHLQGTNAVGSCVTFKMGTPLKSNYQKFIINNSQGNNDYANTCEIVKRRYEKKNIKDILPDLIIADGGVTQMNAIDEIVNKYLHLNIEIIGLKKNKNHITNKIISRDSFKEIDIPITTDVFTLLAKIQNEVHRFAINFHKKKRSKNQNKSALDNIPGIGPKTKELLLLKYKSVKGIKRTSIEELIESIGEKKANIVYEKIHENEYI